VLSPTAAIVGDEHLGEPHAVVVADDDGLTSRDDAVVDVDVERLARCLVELEHRARADSQNLAMRIFLRPISTETSTGTSMTKSRLSMLRAWLPATAAMPMVGGGLGGVAGTEKLRSCESLRVH